ncbi:glycosyltransferase family 2 protein [Kineococcus glutinatus]|uniref:Glycosyltransferase family 2 protein n=1 Tax=Kineococcus glutinatus TaxID=1070872 RepID=A0ABP9HLZ7_9ACTN
MPSLGSCGVLMCVYTEERWTVMSEALDALTQQTRSPDEVVVVVDHNAALAARLRSERPSLRVIANEGARGLSGARNSGTAAMTSDVIAFLDDDAVPRPDWLERLAEPFEEAAVVAVGGWAIPRWPTSGVPAVLPDELLWIVGCSYRGLPRDRREIRNVIGCSMAFRRQAVLDAGGFTDGIGRVGKTPLGCEETELCIRIRQRQPSVRIVSAPDAVVDHLVSPDRVTWAYLLRRSWAEGLSKALVARLVGASDGLSSERTYARRVLPAGVLRGVAGGRRGLESSAAIVACLVTTTAGYLCGSAATAGRRRGQRAA